jgi:peroxisomal membrane protein 4
MAGGMDIFANDDLRPLLAIVKGFRNGAVYGAKIRFPHALVMTFLFRGGR